MTEILGRPVRGVIDKTRGTSEEQWGPERFIELVDGVLAVDGVEAVKWQQYTPYFNDGEPCEFGIHQVFVKLTGVSEEEGEYENGWFYEGDLRPYNSDTRKYEVKPEYAGALAAIKDLEQNMGHFEHFLSDTFGDHAEVTATHEGFDVEHYDHE